MAKTCSSCAIVPCTGTGARTFGALLCANLKVEFKYVCRVSYFQVEYDDGDVEHLHLGAEEVRLQLVPGEAERLAPQGPAGLLQAAAAMAADAAALQQRLAERQQQEQQQQQGGGKAKQNGKGDGPSKGSKQQQREGTGEEGGGQGEQEEAAGKEEEDADELAAKGEVFGIVPYLWHAELPGRPYLTPLRITRRLVTCNGTVICYCGMDMSLSSVGLINNLDPYHHVQPSAGARALLSCERWLCCCSSGRRPPRPLPVLHPRLQQHPPPRQQELQMTHGKCKASSTRYSRRKLLGRPRATHNMVRNRRSGRRVLTRQQQTLVRRLSPWPDPLPTGRRCRCCGRARWCSGRCAVRLRGPPSSLRGRRRSGRGSRRGAGPAARRWEGQGHLGRHAADRPWVSNARRHRLSYVVG